MTIRQSSVTQLLDTLKAKREAFYRDVPMFVWTEIVKMSREDAENVYRRAMMHAEDIERAELVQDMWELERIPA